MSGQIQKRDIITEEALKVFREIIEGYKNLLVAVEKASGGLKKEKTSLTELAKIKKQIEVLKERAQADYQKELVAKRKLIAVQNNINNADKKAAAANKKNIAERIAAYKRMVANEKKGTNERIAAAKRVAALDKKNIAERIAAYRRVAAFEKKDMSARVAAYKRVVTATKKKTNAFKDLIKSAGAYLIAMVGIQQVLRFFTSTLFNLTKKLDSLQFSMKTVIKDSNELAATNIFLTKTAVDYGLDVLTLTERYIKFRAASQQSNMTSRETMRIFNSTAKAAAVLGLKTDEVNGVFLALEQMISKGKITTEELRRQLGERLPGAMGIMADAVGVSISELDKMLKKGEVLSADALPKFAIALEKAYGIESLTKVDNLAAAHGRLKTSWVLFVGTLEASNEYRFVIDGMTAALTRFKYALNTASANEGAAYFDMLNSGITETSSNIRKWSLGWNVFARFFEKDAKQFQELIQDMTEAEREGAANSEEYFKDRLSTIGFSLEEAAVLWEQYAIRIGLITDPKKVDYIKPFDIEQYKDDLDRAEKDTDTFSKLASSSLKEYVVESSSLMEKHGTTYISVINGEIKAKKEEALAANTLMIRKEGLYKLAKGIDAEEKNRRRINAEKAVENYDNILKALVNLESRRADILNKKGGKDDTLAIAKLRNAQILALREEQFNFGESLRIHELEKEVELLNIKKKLNDDLLQYTTKGMKEYERILADSAKIQTDIAQTKTQLLLTIDEEFHKSRLETEKVFLEERIATLINGANVERVKLGEDANLEFQNSKKRAKDKIAIQGKLAINLLEAEFELANNLQALHAEGTDEWATQEERKNQLKEQLSKIGLDITKRYSDAEIAERQRVFAEITRIGNEGFEVFSQLNENASQRAENRYEREMQAAGENESMQLSAKRKLEEEERKIAKRQAIAAKAQAVFNIGLSTAMGISKTIGTLGFPAAIPFIVAQAILGAAQLAAALGAPLPQFAEGVENFGGGLAIVGDKKGSPDKAGGSELLKFTNGKMALSPSTPTVMNLPPGTDAIPNDETTRILAQSAVTKTYDMVDMSTTNNHLKNISKNTSESVTFENGYKIIRKKGFVGRYKV